MGCFLETLGVDAGAEADFDSRAEGLGVGDCGDARVVDLALRALAPHKFQEQGVAVGWLGGTCLDEGIFVEEVFRRDFEGDAA